MTEPSLARRLWNWFLYGVAFTVGMAAIWLVLGGISWLFFEGKIESINRTDGLEIVEHRSHEIPNGVKIVGVIRNTSDQVKDHVEITATFYDAEGKVVDTYDGRVTATLQPGADAPFKIQCAGESVPLASHVRYDVRVAKAWSQ